MATPKVRVYELSKALDVPNKEIIAFLETELGVEVKSHSSSIDQEIADKAVKLWKREQDGGSKEPVKSSSDKKDLSTQKELPKAGSVSPSSEPKIEKPAPKVGPEKKPIQQVDKRSPESKAPAIPSQKNQPVANTQKPKPEPQGKPLEKPTPPGKASVENKEPKPKQEVQESLEEAPKKIRIDDPLTVRELSEKLDMRETDIIKHLFMKGTMVTVNQTLDIDFSRDIAIELGFEIEKIQKKEEQGEYSSTTVMEKKTQPDAEKFKNLQERPPVVSIMGHVDHGKTSLLDAIRETRHKIVDTEAGGITQRIGAYTVEKDGQRIVFLDTPGHEAFTAMRMRGAQATDIAILVVAADDGVMPQTIEAINHAKAASIPIIVAVNKIDKDDADPERVLTQLMDHGLVPEKWGGDTVTVEVSALEKLGLEDVLEMIILVSELLELKADPTVSGEGVIVEAKLDKHKGPVATVLVQNGQLKVGDLVLMGPVGGRVRALINDNGERIEKAGPATPVEILGLDEVPKAGDKLEVIKNEKQYKSRLNTEKIKFREQRLGGRIRQQGISMLPEDGKVEQQEFNVIVKTDTQGSAEAVNDAIMSVSTDEVKVKILHTGTGHISEADVMLASASEAIIIGFNVKEDPSIQRVLEQNPVTIKVFDVIYHLAEELEKIVLGKLAPEYIEVEVGQLEVRQIFTVGKTTVIAGCMVTKGKAVRNGTAKVYRNDQEIFHGAIKALKRFKDDAKEVAAGYECGMSFEKFNDLQEGDQIIVFQEEEVQMGLGDLRNKMKSSAKAS